ncbi:MAG: hypothetical protein R2812_08425 [Gelidibacter sp.]|nr:hypothetical protein [Gelidibacter sp.]
MKKVFLLLILTIGLLSFSSPKNEIPNGKLTDAQLEYVKKIYNWNSEELLIVNFKQPERRCHYNNYQHFKESEKWWDAYYSKIELTNVRNIFVYSDSKKAKEIIDSKKHFADMDSFFLNNFFSKEKTCDGIVIINKNGDYQKKAGEYTLIDIAQLINKLK